MSTKGEGRVRINFNVNKDTLVDQLKSKSAELIDLVETIAGKDSELIRLKSLAQTDFESAVHWAVKAATYQLNS